MKKTRFDILALVCVCLFGKALNAQVECVSLNGYTDIYLEFVSTDDNTFPPGTLFVSSGNISYMKLGNVDVYQTINGDTLGYLGDIGIDVSYPQCSSKILVFSVDTLDELTVDDEQVFTAGNTIGSYNGMNFSVSHAANSPYTIQGQFDLVKLFSGQNRIYDVCLTCIGAGVDELKPASVMIYPNPVKGRMHVKSILSIETCRVLSTAGNVLSECHPDPVSGEVHLSGFLPGHYFLQVQLAGNRIEHFPFQYIGE
jgi:hypothetical protein